MEPRPRTKSSKQKEIDRVIQEGEEMRLAVVIQMPTQQDKAKKRRSWGSDEDEDEVAWETGMELGVWEGTVGR
jgi:glucose dehydrogenase